MKHTLVSRIYKEFLELNTEKITPLKTVKRQFTKEDIKMDNMQEKMLNIISHWVNSH